MIEKIDEEVKPACLTAGSSPEEVPARLLRGVGPRKSDFLKKLGIETVSDLLYHFPRRYEDRSQFVAIADLKPDLPKTIQGQVASTSVYRSKKGTFIFQLAIKDATGTLFALWFNQPYMRTWFKAGQTMILYGRVEKVGRKFQMYVPEFEIVTQDDQETIHTGRIVPVYPSTSGMHQRALRALAKRAVDQYADAMVDFLPQAIRERQELLQLTAALKGIHFPQTLTQRDRSQERLGFDDLFLFQIAVAIRRHQFKTASGIAHQPQGPLVQTLEKKLPFRLTAGQRQAIDEIFNDMAAPRPMHRLLQGDVGSGKTVVSALAVACAVQSGHQAALMAPTEILAEQHFSTMRQWLEPAGIRVGLLTGSISDEARSQLLALIHGGKMQMVIGTHALLQKDVRFQDLSLVIIDEQHKFGVDQRATLRDKAKSPDVLVMTATPIPRTLALTVYGDLDVSAIRELPPGRQPIKTGWVQTDRRADAYQFLAKTMNEGRQCYVVCPRIGSIEARAFGQSDFFELPEVDLKAATKIFEHFRDQVFTGYRVGLLHGRLPDEEKARVMKEFKAGHIQLLVSTQVIEVGIDVPNATVMLIEQADRFGLSQLHQLRGRVGRGSHQSHCILMADPTTPEGKARIQAMVTTQDGFEIAEADLKLRGPGEVFGRRQSGAPELRMASLLMDPKWLDRARQEAFAVVEQDPALATSTTQPIRQRLNRLYENLGLRS